MGNERLLESKTLVASMEERAKHYEALKEQFVTLKGSFQKIVKLDDFRGKGADAIKGFYEGQANVADAWIDIIDVRVAFFKGISGETDDLDLSGDTIVHVPFLEDDLQNAHNRANDIVTSQQDKLGEIFNAIDDIITLQTFSKDSFDEQINSANKQRTETIDKVLELDAGLVDEYSFALGQENLMVGLFTQLLEATAQGSSISPINFDAQNFHNSEVYKLRDEAKENKDAYLENKKMQNEQRQLQKEMEALENRPWYEKTWDTVSTFTGEVTGYYDTKRAATGIDPVTGEKLSEAERVKAAAFAAAGFIPVVGWAGRAAKGGNAVYKTVKGAKAVEHSLDAYKYAQSLDYLRKAEYGVYGLASANGFGEYLTGKDMFGNKLDEDKRKQSLTEALIVLGVGGVGYKLDKPFLDKEIYRPVLKNKDMNKLAGWEYRPGDFHYLNNKKVFDNSKYYNQKNGNINWPAKDGFDGKSAKKTLEKGKLVDRFGSPEGGFLSPEGVPYDQRALALHSDYSDYYVYKVVEPLEVEAGKIAPWFGRDGGGTQFMKYKENGRKYTINELKDSGAIIEVYKKEGYNNAELFK